MIPFKKVNLGNAYEQVKPLFDSGMIGLGTTMEIFEKTLAEYLGAKYVIATSSCTAALFLSLEWERFQKGVANVYIPSMTVPLVYSAAYEAGMTVAFDQRTDWVGGHYQISGTDVIDSAHELRRNQFSEIQSKEHIWDPKVCYSFYPTKTIGSADGGAIATDNLEFAEWARHQTTYGRTRDQYKSTWNYDVVALGHKLHYDNLRAAICLEQLARLDETNKRRQEIVAAYNKGLGYNNNSDYLYRINVSNRDEFIRYMEKNGVECGVHFKPLHLMKPFKNVVMYDRQEVEAAYNMTVSLPLYDLLNKEEIDKIIELTLSYHGNIHAGMGGVNIL